MPAEGKPRRADELRLQRYSDARVRLHRARPQLVAKAANKVAQGKVGAREFVLCALPRHGDFRYAEQQLKQLLFSNREFNHCSVCELDASRAQKIDGVIVDANSSRSLHRFWPV